MMFGKLTLATVTAYAMQSASAASIYGIANTTADFSTLAAAVDAAGLTETLSGGGADAFTVFAPPNSAFEKLDAKVLEKLLDPVWQPQLQDVILYHALAGAVLSSQLTDGMTAPTLNFQGQEILINLDPTRVNENSQVIGDLVDVSADNGVVHGIDTVLTPTSVTSNIVDIAAGDARFTTLVEAVTKAGLVDALSGDGPFTVFAPTNDAFAAIDPAKLASLLLPENKDDLIEILQYHVVSANALSTSLTNGDVLPTLDEDETLAIEVSDAGVKVNDANVIIADIIASNGIIHVVDQVLLEPPDDLGDVVEGVVDPVVNDPAAVDPADPVDTGIEDTVDTGTAAPTVKPTTSPTTASGAFTQGTAVAAVAIAAGILTIA